MSISLNALFYGDESTKVLEKGCTFCNKKNQCRLSYTIFSKKCKLFNHEEVAELIDISEMERVNN